MTVKWQYPMCNFKKIRAWFDSLFKKRKSVEREQDSLSDASYWPDLDNTPARINIIGGVIYYNYY